MKTLNTRFIATLSLALLTQSCSKGIDSSPASPNASATAPVESTTCTDAQLNQLEVEMANILDIATPEQGADENFSMALTAPDNRNFTYARNNINGTNPAPMSAAAEISSASTAKMVTASIIMDLVTNPSLQINLNGKAPLNLDSYVKDYLPAAAWLTSAELSPTSKHRFNSMTLRHLLSFTSGLEQDDACIGSNTSPDACVHKLLLNNRTSKNSNVLKRSFYYAGAHLAVASRLATNVTGKSWFTLFEEFKQRYSVFQTPTQFLASGAVYPNSQTGQMPNPAGALRYIVDDYAQFMRKFYYGGMPMRDEMMTLQLTASKQQLPLTGGMYSGAPFDTLAPVTYSPARDEKVKAPDGSSIIIHNGEDWGYGLGVWLECNASTFNNSCLTGVYAAAGSFGAYGMIDMNLINGTNNIITGFMGRQGQTGSFNPNLYRLIKEKAHKWAAKSCA